MTGKVTRSEMVEAADGNMKVSAFFRSHVHAAKEMCQKEYNNVTACHVLANLCVLTLYDLSGEAQSLRL